MDRKLIRFAVAILAAFSLLPAPVFPQDQKRSEQAAPKAIAGFLPVMPKSAGKSRLVIANWVEKFKTSRLTFTLPVLNAARCVTFLVSGTDKAPALHAVLESDAPGEQYPSKLIRPTDGKLIWLVDRAAASELASHS